MSKIDFLKKCSKCGEVKSINKFPPHKLRKDGHGGHCHKCHYKWKMARIGEQRFNALTLKAKMGIGKKADRVLIKLWLKKEMEQFK